MRRKRPEYEYPVNVFIFIEFTKLIKQLFFRNIFFKNSSYYLYTCLFCSFKCTSFIRHILRLFARSQYRKCRYSSLFLQRFSFFSHCFKQ